MKGFLSHLVIFATPALVCWLLVSCDVNKRARQEYVARYIITAQCEHVGYKGRSEVSVYRCYNGLLVTERDIK